MSAVIMLIVAFGLWAETRPWGQKLGGPLLLLAISMAASNVCIIPHTAAVYDTVAGLLVPMAIPMLLLRADFKTIFSESGPVFIAFLLAAGATIAGCLAGVWLIDMGPLEAEIAGTVTSSFGKPIMRHVSSEFGLGTLFMYIFFVCIGAGADLGVVLGTAFPILLFIVVMVLVHLCLLVIVGKMMKLDLAEVMIASNACILGPPTAAALAASKGWQPLIAPGILVGLFGYAIATFIGIGLTALLKM